MYNVHLFIIQRKTYNIQRALPHNHSDHSAAHLNEFRVLYFFFVFFFFFYSFACGSESPQLATDQNNCGLFGNEVFALILIVIADGYFVNNTTDNSIAIYNRLFLLWLLGKWMNNGSRDPLRSFLSLYLNKLFKHLAQWRYSPFTKRSRITTMASCSNNNNNNWSVD